jgi:membrane protein implicated in regulation of membrane protease activity
MGKRERFFLLLVVVLATSLIVAVLSWIADDLALAAGSGMADLPGTLLTVSLLTMLASIAMLVIIGPGVFRRRLTPPDFPIKGR